MDVEVEKRAEYYRIPVYVMNQEDVINIANEMRACALKDDEIVTEKPEYSTSEEQAKKRAAAGRDEMMASGCVRAIIHKGNLISLCLTRDEYDDVSRFHLSLVGHNDFGYVMLTEEQLKFIVGAFFKKYETIPDEGFWHGPKHFVEIEDGLQDAKRETAN